MSYHCRLSLLVEAALNAFHAYELEFGYQHEADY